MANHKNHKKIDFKYNFGTYLQFMKNYKWSSCPDYFDTGKRDFLAVINKDLFYDLFDLDEKFYQKELKDFIKNPVLKFKID